MAVLCAERLEKLGDCRNCGGETVIFPSLLKTTPEDFALIRGCIWVKDIPKANSFFNATISRDTAAETDQKSLSF